MEWWELAGWSSNAAANALLGPVNLVYGLLLLQAGREVWPLRRKGAVLLYALAAHEIFGAGLHRIYWIMAEAYAPPGYWSAPWAPQYRVWLLVPIAVSTIAASVALYRYLAPGAWWRWAVVAPIGLALVIGWLVGLGGGR